ncbi:MAG: hypothetical protein HDR01_05750 [Lachnospiraceae bacterium]|nr:hypothetical protein [Lachnospiraceae bacterium]
MGKQYSLDLNGADFDEIILNQHGDKIEISADNARLFDRFANGYDEIIKLSEEMPGRLEAVEKETADKDDISKSVATSRVRVDFCEKGIGIIDSIFGEGTTKKVFRDDYEKDPDFLPDEDLFIAFFEKFAPIMEDIFDRKLKRQEKASKQRMAKYQPQDHKRKQK